MLGKEKQGIGFELRNVSFAYGKNDPIYQNLNLAIKPGEKIAVVGENGAGKTTLIRLLLGQYQVQNGEILLDGKNVHDYQQQHLYEATSVLMQDFDLIMFMTIRQNFQMATSRKLSDADIDAALELVDLKDFVHGLKHGLDSRLAPSFEHGISVSGGQLQRLAVARSFARQSRLLIMDEPTSAVDAKAEKKIFDNIFNLHAAATTIIISHRFSTVRKADRIIVIDKGSIIEDGTHEALLKSGGLYHEMFTRQAEGYR